MKIEADISQWPGLQSAINAGWEVIDFRSPKSGEKFIATTREIMEVGYDYNPVDLRPIVRLKPIKSTDIIDALRHNLTVNRIDISGDEYTIYAKDNRHGKSNG